jgi:Leucine-rich repeat (LRR) protein
MQTELQDYFNRLCCPTPVVNYNFDVDSSDWAGAGITDKASFESLLGVTTSDFLLSGNNIKANVLTTTGNYLQLKSKTLTNVNYITVSGLQVLNLSDNQLTTFNPTIALPSTLVNLNLSVNQIVTFNPTIALPSSLQSLNLSSNQMTTLGYTASEPWANGMHTAPSGGVIYLNDNTDSASGTNLEAILISKGWNVLS